MDRIQIAQNKIDVSELRFYKVKTYAVATEKVPKWLKGKPIEWGILKTVHDAESQKDIAYNIEEYRLDDLVKLTQDVIIAEYERDRTPVAIVLGNDAYMKIARDPMQCHTGAFRQGVEGEDVCFDIPAEFKSRLGYRCRSGSVREIQPDLYCNLRVIVNRRITGFVVLCKEDFR
jgi:hypothetical protein